MKDLIKALQIFAKYKDEPWPTHCEHDVLYIVNISKDAMSTDDVAAVESLGFLWSDSDGWISYKFGSA